MSALQAENLKKAIWDIDLSMVISKMMNSHGWSKEDADEACVLYRNYLFLLAKYPKKSLPPSQDIDEFWHNHILDTKKYRAECDKIFGKYMDHKPSYFLENKETEMKALESGFQETQRLHFEEFGEHIYEIRGPFKKLISGMKLLRNALLSN